MISAVFANLTKTDKAVIQRALDDRLNDNKCEDCGLSNGEIDKAVHFYEDFKEDIRRRARRSGKRQSDAMSIVLKAAISLEEDEEILSVFNETDTNWFNIYQD